MHQKLSLLSLLLLFVFLKTVSLKENEDEETFRTAVSDSQLKLAYGMPLICFLKHFLVTVYIHSKTTNIIFCRFNVECQLFQPR